MNKEQLLTRYIEDSHFHISDLTNEDKEEYRSAISETLDFKAFCLKEEVKELKANIPSFNVEYIDETDRLVSRFENYASETHYDLKEISPPDYYIEYCIFKGELKRFIAEMNEEKKQEENWSFAIKVTIGCIGFLLGFLLAATLLLY